jgi:hypothetical protein
MSNCKHEVPFLKLDNYKSYKPIEAARDENMKPTAQLVA